MVLRVAFKEMLILRFFYTFIVETSQDSRNISVIENRVLMIILRPKRKEMERSAPAVMNFITYARQKRFMSGIMKP